MLDLYIANKNYSSWSLRPWILMKQLGIPFTEHLTPFEADNWQAFRRFSPSGKVPCLVDGQITVWDSLSIVEYLAESFPEVWPSDRAARAWARSACAEMHAGFNALRDQCSMNCSLRLRLHETGSELKMDIARLDELWTQGLTRFAGPWLAGAEFTAADAFFSAVAFRVQTYGLELSPAAGAYVQRLLALPGMQEWQAAAADEPWLDEPHESDCLRAGELLLDTRTWR